MIASELPQLAPLNSLAAIVSRAQQGDREAFGLIWERHHDEISRFIGRTMGRSGDSQDAADLTQDVFVKAWLKIRDTSEDLKLSAWLYRIAYNRCMDELRRRQVIQWPAFDRVTGAYAYSVQPDGECQLGSHLRAILDPQLLVHDTAEQPDLALEHAETAQEVQQFLHRLALPYRVVLILREYHDLSCDEIAEVLNTTRPAVKSLLFRARNQFRTLWLAEGPWHPVYQ